MRRPLSTIYAFLLALCMPTLTGCGGGGSGGGTLTPAPSPAARGALARFDVDVASGSVKITPVEDANSPSRAIITGSAISFQSSELLSAGGDSGQRILKIKAVNNSGQPLGANARVIVSNLLNAGEADFRLATQVTTFAGGTAGSNDGYRTSAQFLSPSSIALGRGPSANRIFVTDEGNNTIRKIEADGFVTTFAGTAGAGSYAEGTGSTARFNIPGSVSVDPNGNVYVGDFANHRIRRITPLGEVKTFAGTGQPGQDNNYESNSTFESPVAVTTPDGNRIFVADPVAHTVRRIDLIHDPSLPNVFRIGGTAYTPGVPAAFRYNTPSGIAVYTDSQGKDVWYVADTNNHCIRILDTHPAVVGNGTPGSEDGVGTVVRCNAPKGVAVIKLSDGRPLIVFSDTGNHTIRAVFQLPGSNPFLQGSYRAVTLAGSAGVPGLADGTGVDARFRDPQGVAIVDTGDPSPTILVADRGNNAIRKVIVPGGLLQTGGPATAVTEPVRLLNGDREVAVKTAWVKTLTAGTSGYETELQFYVPNGVSGFSFTAYVETDTGFVNLPAAGASALATLAGDGQPGSSNGPGKIAQMNAPYGVAAVPTALQSAYGIASGVRAFFVDAENHRVRHLDNEGRVGTFAGTYAGFQDGAGLSARFRRPRCVAVGPDGSLFVTDSDNRQIRRISTSGVVSTVAGTGGGGAADGYGNEATFTLPEGIAADGGGTLWVTDGPAHTVRRIEYQGGDPASPPSYIVRTVAGTAGQGGTTDATGAAARFNLPTGIAADTDGRVYVVDAGSGRLRVLTRSGVNSMAVTTLATGLGTPTGLALDSAHNLYVSDFAGSKVVRVNPQGSAVILMGSAGSGFSDGASGKMNGPRHVSVEPGGNLLVADYFNHSLRVILRVISEGVPSSTTP